MSTKSIRQNANLRERSRQTYTNHQFFEFPFHHSMQYLWRSTAKSRASLGGVYGQGKNREMAKIARPKAAQDGTGKVAGGLVGLRSRSCGIFDGTLQRAIATRPAMRRPNRRL
jgi:hypothetical protein